MYRVLRAPAFALVLVLLCPGLASAASYGDGDTSDVGIAMFPFEVERSSDRSLAFALEDSVQRALPGLINQPVFTGRETNRALKKSTEECTTDRFCVRLLGNQFNSSLVVRVKIFRVGGDVQVETEWFTTGNGLRVGRENTAFVEGDSETLVQAIAAWWSIYWDTSLRVQPEVRAREGGLIDDSRGSGGDWYGKEAKETQKRRESGGTRRREDFNSSRETDLLFDRNDPTADLRDIVAGLDGDRRDRSERDLHEDRREDRRQDRRRARDEASPYGSDAEIDREAELDLDESAGDSSSGRRQARRYDPSPSPSTSRSRPTSSRAAGPPLDRAGFGNREALRFESSGLSESKYQERRYALKKRFYLRTGGFVAAGYLKRRYFVFAFVRTGGVKTEEYGWESLGPVPLAGGGPPPGGGMVGVGFAPLDFIAVEVDASFMAAQQSLRWEYEGHDIGTNASDNGGAGPDGEDQPVMHIALDIRARGFVFPKRKLKLTPGLGVTMLILTGFKITPTPPLNFSSRPDTVVVGLTPIFGFNYALSPFISLFGDFSATVYLSQGHADDEFHDFFGGGTASEITPQFLEPRIKSRPIMGRAAFGVMLNF
jgi:hypothetical protein